MRFEKADDRDIARLIDLRLAYLTEDLGQMDEREAALLADRLRDYFERNLNARVFAYAAREGEEIVSCALLLVVEKPASPAFPTGNTGMVLNVYTKPEYRQKGYARRVMNLLLADADRMGLDPIELKATGSGRRLYRLAGFEDADQRYRLMKRRKPAEL